MPRAEPPRRTPVLPPGASDPPTMRSAPPTLRIEPGDEDTIAVPLTSAATLPCPRLAPDELPTLRAAPGELAELIELTRRSDAPPAIHRRVPEQLEHISEPPVRQPDSGQIRRQLQGSSRPAASTSRRVELHAGPGLRGSAPSARGAAAAPRSPAGGCSAMMPTQLWLGPVAAGPVLPRPLQRQGFWARLWTLLGFRARPGARPWSAVATGINGHEGSSGADRRCYQGSAPRAGRRRGTAGVH